MTRALRIGIEGPCCAGKTTLSRQLAERLSPRRVHHVQDYSDFVGGGRHLPPAVPASLAAEEKALRRFLELEVERARHVRELTEQDGIVLIDRSIHTILAHCHGLGHFQHIDYSQVTETVIAHSTLPLWPDLVVYLDVPQRTVAERNRGKFPRGSVFTDSAFNAGIRCNFLGPPRREHPPLLRLDATRDVRVLSNHVAAWLGDVIDAVPTAGDGGPPCGNCPCLSGTG
jgi:thymidylate kinase